MREVNEIERDKVINADFVALDLDPALGTSPPSEGWRNLVIEGENFDAFRHLGDLANRRLPSGLRAYLPEPSYPP